MKFSEIQSVWILDHEEYFTVHWKMFTWCNYKCSYCLYSKKNYSNTIDYDKMRVYAEKLNLLLSKIHKPIHLHLIGGEISYIDLISILNIFMIKNFKKLSIVSNFSNDISWYKTIEDYCKKRNIDLSFCASLHDEYVSVEDFVNKVEQIKDITHIQFTVTDKNIDNYHKLINLCEQKGIMYKTEYDKRNEINIKFYKHSDNFPIKCKVVYKNGNKEVMPIPKFRQEITYDENKFYCESNSYILLDYFGKFYNGSCGRKKCLGDINSVDNDFLLNLPQKELCTRGFCHLCYPMKIFNISEKPFEKKIKITLLKYKVQITIDGQRTEYTLSDDFESILESALREDVKYQVSDNFSYKLLNKNELLNLIKEYKNKNEVYRLVVICNSNGISVVKNFIKSHDDIHSYFECCSEFGNTIHRIKEINPNIKLYASDFCSMLKCIDSSITKYPFENDLGYIDVLKKLKGKHFDCIFYDANHCKSNDLAIKHILNISWKYLIVHDCDYEDVSNAIKQIQYKSENLNEITKVFYKG